MKPFYLGTLLGVLSLACCGAPSQQVLRLEKSPLPLGGKMAVYMESNPHRPWDALYPVVRGVPDSWRDATVYYAETDLPQLLYQGYRQGLADEKFCMGYFNVWGLDTASRSARPIRSVIAMAAGVTAEGHPAYLFDTDGDDDLSDETVRYFGADSVAVEVTPVYVERYGGGGVVLPDLAYVYPACRDSDMLLYCAECCSGEAAVAGGRYAVTVKPYVRNYDADSAGGIIRITLKKRRENGVNGSVAFNTTQGEIVHRYNPSANINLHSGRVDFYASAWGSFGKDETTTGEQTRYEAADKELNAHSSMKGRNRSLGASAGAVVEIDNRNSVGAEFEYWRNRNGEPNDTYTDFRNAGTVTRTDSHFDKLDIRNNYSATFNYIRKIDTLGSTLKLLADYTRRETDSGNDNFSRMTAPGATADSTYRDNTESVYNIATATLALEKRFSPRWTLKAGAKYTYNDMHNDALYEYLKGDAWTRNDNQSFTIDYTENIAAAYAVASAQLGRWGLVAGLRGEYTHTTGKSVGQDYFSLFPNANVSFALSKEKGWSLIAQYARTIERPRFWCLNPQRMQISDYTYQTGNPSLDPAFKQDVNLTLVAAHKYTLTAGVQLVSGEIQQTIQADPENPDLLQLAWVNYDRTKNYYVSVNLPFQPAKWWQLNANFTYMRHGERVEQHGAETFYNWAFGSISTTFTLPAKFYIDLSYNYQSRIDLGNCWVEPDHRLQAGVKKRFGDQFTASFSVQNLLDQGQVIGAHGDGFVRTMNARQTWSNRSFRIGLTYNFKSGKAFKRKAVEAGSADEKSRL